MSARTCVCGLACGFALEIAGLLVPATAADAQDEIAAFYRGRTVQAVVGYTPGSTFEFYLSTFARHLGRHVPGNPNIVVQHMPGAGSLKAAAYLAGVAPKDGSVIGIINPVTTIEPLIDPPNAKFDPRAFNWLGSLNSEISTCGFWSRDLKTLADLKGHSIGVPGPFGSTYTGLLALLYKANLSLSDVKVQSIGFTQVAALLGHKVDAIMGYSNNEPLQLQAHGLNVRTFAVSDYQPLVSNGIIALENIYRNQQPMVRDFVQATLKGLKEVISNPAEAVEISKQYVPGLAPAQATSVLQATIPLWQSSNGQLGYNDSTTWQSMEQFLVAQKIIAPVQNLTQVYTNQTVA